MSEISLGPTPYEQLDGLSDRERSLQYIGDNIGYWIKWTTRQHEAESIEVSPDTHVMLSYENAPPHWPSVGQLTRWLEVIRATPND